MEYKNSYIFLKRNEESSKISKKSTADVVSSLPSLLEKSFEKIEFDCKDSNTGNIVIKNNNRDYTILFKYYSVHENYYLDIIVNLSNGATVVNILNDINKILIGKNNLFDKYYVSIVSYDYSSEYYCNKLFPHLNKFERKLRQVLFNVYTLNFNINYYEAMPSKELQDNIEKKSKQINKELNEANNSNVSKEDCFIKYAFYSLDYSDIDKLLFTKYTPAKDSDNVQDFLNSNEDLSKLDDKELRKQFELLKQKNDWERFFGNKRIDDNFQKILSDIRLFRNNIVHCKFFSKDQYSKCLKLLNHNTKSLDIAISITEEEDFLNMNFELQQESFYKTLKMISDTVINTYKPFMDNIELITQPINELREEISLMMQPLNSAISNIPSITLPEVELPKFNIPSITLPEIELPKFNIPYYFDDIEAEDDDKY